MEFPQGKYANTTIIADGVFRVSWTNTQDGVAGGKNDLYDISGSEIDGITTIEFKRKLVTGDSFDVPLVKGDNPFLIAIGDGKDIGAYHSLVSFGKIVIS